MLINEIIGNSCTAHALPSLNGHSMWFPKKLPCTDHDHARQSIKIEASLDLCAELHFVAGRGSSIALVDGRSSEVPSMASASQMPVTDGSEAQFVIIRDSRGNTIR